MAEAVGAVFGEILRADGEQGEAAENAGGGRMLVWGNVHVLAYPVKIQRLPGDRQVLRKVAQTGDPQSRLMA